jgi:ABC-type transport system involved in multi-copper enzyme maturation permease subunit
MNAFKSLVELFLRDLVRRRMVWIIIVALGVMFWFTELMRNTVEEALQNGESYDIATRKAISQLASIGDNIRHWLPLVAAVLALQLAPESRRNGTTQFVLSQGVGRVRLALAQYVALCLFLLAIVLIVHAGYFIAGMRLGAVSVSELALSWITLTATVFLLAAMIHAMAMTLSPIEVVLLLLAIPMLAHSLPQMTSSLSNRWTWLLTLSDNITLLYPKVDAMLPWPHLWFDARVHWSWSLAHGVLASTFWIVLGYWLLRHQDVGSRTAIK